MITLTKEGQQSSANTHEYICDTVTDLDKIQDAPHGSIALIIEPFGVKIMGENGWTDLG